jgi:hypothetical protein
MERDIGMADALEFLPDLVTLMRVVRHRSVK